MRNPGGYLTETRNEDNKLLSEKDTFTCGHGNEIVEVPPGTASVTVGAFCRMCGKHICDKCAAEMDRTLKCVPFEKRLDAMERRRKLIEF